MFGIINVYKEKNMTSFDVISRLRKIFNEKKIGHTGTLDPNATGVLPICIGHATKLVQYILNNDKQYFVTIKLGIKTDSLDITGKVLKKENIPDLTNQEIEKTILSFIGKQEQIPPMYSAKKQDGKKLYELARIGLEVERKASIIEIYNISDIQYLKDNNTITFLIDCSKGTYIRTLCEDIATKLQTIACLQDLERTKTGVFIKEDSYTINQIEKIYKEGSIKNILYDIDTIFQQYKAYYIKEIDIKRFLNGVNIKTDNVDGMYRIYNENKDFLGLGIVKNKQIKREYII